MFIILILCMLMVPWMIGNGCLHILYRNGGGEFSCWDALLTGWIAVIGAAEAVHLMAVVCSFSLNLCTLLFGGLTVFLTLVSLAMCLFWGFRKGRPSRLFVLPMLLFLGQAAYILFTGDVDLSRDMTLETTASFLYSNGIYQVNPMTGAAYQSGIPFRLKILCLPTLYSMLCRIFSAEPQTVVWQAMPCVTLVCCYGAFDCVGRSLFPDSEKRRACFLTATAVLLWIGSYALGMDGFGVLFSGWRGVTIRNAVLIPYLVSLCLRKKWKLAALCIAAEACLVWTFYGAGACLLLAAGLILCQQMWHRMERGRQSG